MICITGDTHGGFQRFGNKYFPQQREMSRDDYMIISGDFGGLWDGSAEENYWLNWLEDKPWTTLWVDGNHENFDMLKRLPVEEWKNGHDPRATLVGLLDDPDAVDGQKERVSIDNVFFNELALMNFKKGEVVEKEFPFGFTPEDAKFIETVE